MSETHVSSLVVHVRPDRMDEVRAAILGAGAEIPVESPTGKIVAVLESAHESDITRFADAIAVREGVIAANLVFHLIDDFGSDDEPLHDSGDAP
ncbi:MAG: chaperone NapD [Rhodospirillales bacterium]